MHPASLSWSFNINTVYNTDYHSHLSINSEPLNMHLYKHETSDHGDIVKYTYNKYS